MQIYNIQVTDLNSAHTLFKITEPDMLDFVLNVTNNLCFGDCSGEINIIVMGGTTPYLYSANGGVNQQASIVIDNLCSIMHTIEVEGF